MIGKGVQSEETRLAKKKMKIILFVSILFAVISMVQMLMSILQQADDCRVETMEAVLGNCAFNNLLSEAFLYSFLGTACSIPVLWQKAVSFIPSKQCFLIFKEYPQAIASKYCADHRLWQVPPYKKPVHFFWLN